MNRHDRDRGRRPTPPQSAPDPKEMIPMAAATTVLEEPPKPKREVKPAPDPLPPLNKNRGSTEICGPCTKRHREGGLPFPVVKCPDRKGVHKCETCREELL